MDNIIHIVSHNLVDTELSSYTLMFPHGFSGEVGKNGRVRAIGRARRLCSLVLRLAGPDRRDRAREARSPIEI